MVKMPPITPKDAGTWVDEAVHGRFTCLQILEIAWDYGWRPGAGTDPRPEADRIHEYHNVISAFREDKSELPNGIDIDEALHEYLDEAEQHMNSLAPKGYAFTYTPEGSFVLMEAETDCF